MKSTCTIIVTGFAYLLLTASPAIAQQDMDASRDSLFALKTGSPTSSFQDNAWTTQSSGAQDNSTAHSSSAAPAHEGLSEAEINNKLNNPGSDLASLNFKLVWSQYQGDLPGSSSQNSLTMAFQPVFPFKLGGGNNLIIRPTIPMTWGPHFNARSGGFDEDFGLGDAQFLALIGHTNIEKGIIYGGGVTMQLPTHTDSSLGRDDFRLGPAGYVGMMGKWGIVAVFGQHWWNIGGSDGYFSTTEVEFIYWFAINDGWQIGGAPVMSYDWAQDDSDDAWSVPINLGLQKTFRFGKLPVKMRFEGVYHIVTPDSFGPQWGLQLTITPVIANPFEHLASK